MSETLEAVYNDLWKKSHQQLSQGTHHVDPYLNTKEDPRKGITLLARPEASVIAKIQELQNHLRELEPDQYYYPATDLHLTVLSIVSCYKDFVPNKFDASEYIEIIQSCLSNSIEVELRGITASSSGVLVQGFPDTKELNRLRDRLRSSFRSSPLENTIDSRYKINTAHLTVMRFRKPMTNPQTFLSLLDTWRGTSFGKMTLAKLYLVANDWYQTVEKVQDLHTFTLRKNKSYGKL